MPLFAAFQKKIKGYKESRVVMNIPATERFAMNDAGAWFRNRYEIAPETEILIEYQHRDTDGGFATETEYLLIKTDPNAPLNYVRLEMTPHPLSSVPYVFFEGRFWVMATDENLHHREAWQKHIGLEQDVDVTLIVDNNLESEYFTVNELERAIAARTAAQIVTKDGKKKLARIKRSRRINVK